ncbi:MAG: hypothetical protein KAW92_05165 [Candidatus Cloacimonetes bacterium]|nr:hypothetical protein [Candidatus Cloacimonadota bacterium]
MECLYYSDGIISNRKTLTRLCLLFDTVKTFYLSPSYYLKPLEERWLYEKDLPFFRKSPCEKELLSKIYSESYKNFIDENDELINSNVLQPITINQAPPDWESFEANEKKLMKNGAGLSFGLWGQSVEIVPDKKIYIDAPWFSLYRWQSIAGGLHFAIQTEQIPISDNSVLSGLACDTVSRFSKLKHLPTPNEIASNIAFKSMSLLIPNLPDLKSEEILEAREKLADELQLFRNEMLKVSKDINEESYSDIDYIVISRIQPILDDLKLKIKSLKGELFRKIASVFFIGSGATSLMSSLIILPLPAQIAASASFAGKILLDIHKYRSEIFEIRNQSKNRGLVYLLDIEKKYG